MTERVTKAQLAQKLAEAESRAQWTTNAAKVLVAAEAALAGAPDDPEAMAIAKCVKALNAVPKRSSSNYNATQRTDTEAIGRILSYVAARFDVSLAVSVPGEQP